MFGLELDKAWLVFDWQTSEDYQACGRSLEVEKTPHCRQIMSFSLLRKIHEKSNHQESI